MRNLHLTYFCPKYVVPVKIKLEISQNFVAFSEYMNFMKMFLTIRLSRTCYRSLVLRLFDLDEDV